MEINIYTSNNKTSNQIIDFCIQNGVSYKKTTQSKMPVEFVAEICERYDPLDKEERVYQHGKFFQKNIDDILDMKMSDFVQYLNKYKTKLLKFPIVKIGNHYAFGYTKDTMSMITKASRLNKVK